MAVLILPVVLYSLGCSTNMEEIKVEEYYIDWEASLSQITISCHIKNSYNETKQVSIRAWFDPHGGDEGILIEGPRTYNVPPPTTQDYGDQYVEFVFDNVPSFSDACWGLDWALGVINPMEDSYDAYDAHYEEDGYGG